MTDAPRKPFWKRKRWIAAAAFIVAIAYPVSFVPACWALMNTDAGSRPDEWEIIRATYRPLAAVLLKCPERLQATAGWLINLGKPERATFLIKNGTAGILKREVDPNSGMDFVVIYSLW